jgi:peroxiredoxin Q/BCP
MINKFSFIFKLIPVFMISLLSCKAQNITVKEGDAAPDFTLTSDDGKQVKLSDYKGKSNVVLYFYPKDFTGGCTKEACNFRDNISSFKDLNAEVLGVSVDDMDSHKAFKEMENLNFTLLADPDKTVSNLYGVLNSIGLDSRVTFVIDKNGTVKKIYPKVDPSENYKELLDYLKTI